MGFLRSNLVPIIFGVLMGTIGTFFGLFAGLQVSPLIGTFFIFPGGMLTAFLFSGIGQVWFGLPLTVVLQIVWWTFVFIVIRRLVRGPVR